VRVIRCTGDYQDATNAFVRGKYDIALLTYEMFLNLIVKRQGTLNRIGVVIVDEAQFIMDPGRSISVELLLTYLLTACKRGITPQLLALSAVIGNTNGFEHWLLTWVGRGWSSSKFGAQCLPWVKSVVRGSTALDCSDLRSWWRKPCVRLTDPRNASTPTTRLQTARRSGGNGRQTCRPAPFSRPAPS
jgi:hypothetical protein